MSERFLRLLIRKVILEATEATNPEDDDVLGEPDLSAEEEREYPEFRPPDEETIDEMNVVGAAGAPAGNIRGYAAPLANPPVSNGGPQDYLSGKKKKKNKRLKKSK
jgi:hypothetical protein